MSFVVIETQRLLRRGLPVWLMHVRILRPSFTPPVKTHKYSFANTVLTSTVTPLLLPTDRGPPQLSETSLITISTAVGPWIMGPSGLRGTTRRKVGTTIPSNATWSKQ